MSFKRQPAGSLDSMSSGGGGSMVSSSDINAFGGLLVQIGDFMQTATSGGSSGGSSEA